MVSVTLSSAGLSLWKAGCGRSLNAPVEGDSKRWDCGGKPRFLAKVWDFHVGDRRVRGRLALVIRRRVFGLGLITFLVTLPSSIHLIEGPFGFISAVWTIAL